MTRATCAPRATAGAMTALWSSPERRSERCASCAGERLFEQPPCADGHEAGECPEWVCLSCGHALLSGSAVWSAREPGAAGNARPQVTATV